MPTHWASSTFWWDRRWTYSRKVGESQIKWLGWLPHDRRRNYEDAGMEHLHQNRSKQETIFLVHVEITDLFKHAKFDHDLKNIAPSVLCTQKTKKLNKTKKHQDTIFGILFVVQYQIILRTFRRKTHSIWAATTKRSNAAGKTPTVSSNDDDNESNFPGVKKTTKKPIQNQYSRNILCLPC